MVLPVCLCECTMPFEWIICFESFNLLGIGTGHFIGRINALFLYTVTASYTRANMVMEPRRVSCWWPEAGACRRVPMSVVINIMAFRQQKRANDQKDEPTRGMDHVIILQQLSLGPMLVNTNCCSDERKTGCFMQALHLV